MVRNRMGKVGGNREEAGETVCELYNRKSISDKDGERANESERRGYILFIYIYIYRNR